MKRWLRLILAALTPLCISAVCLSTNRGLSAPPSIEKNIAETAAPGYKTWWDVHPAPVQSLRGGFDGPPRPRQPGIVVVNVGKRVIQRELSFLRPIVRLHQRGSVLFLSDGSFKAIRPDYPWGLELVESETGDEAETVRLETTARNDNPNYDEEGGESRVWHFPMLPPCALVVPTAQPRDHLPTEDPAPVRIQVSMSWEGRVAVFEETVAGRHEAEEVALLLGRALQFYGLSAQVDDVDLQHFHPSHPPIGGDNYYWTETTAHLIDIAQRLRVGVMAIIEGDKMRCCLAGAPHVGDKRLTH